jgi:hypothetical protein
MIYLSDLLYYLGLPQFTDVPIYFDLWPLLLSVMVIWFCADMVLEYLQQQRYQRDQKLLEILIYLEQKERK